MSTVEPRQHRLVLFGVLLSVHFAEHGPEGDAESRDGVKEARHHRPPVEQIQLAPRLALPVLAGWATVGPGVLRQRRRILWRLPHLLLDAQRGSPTPGSVRTGQQLLSLPIAKSADGQTSLRLRGRERSRLPRSKEGRSV